MSRKLTLCCMWIPRMDHWIGPEPIDQARMGRVRPQLVGGGGRTSLRWMYGRMPVILALRRIKQKAKGLRLV